METAKVDIRKLQTLNDSINRTIEALNQVRLSVHGASLAHSAPIGLQGVASPAYLGAYGVASPYSGLPISAQFSPQLFGVLPGLGHSAPNSSFPNLAQAAYGNPLAAGINPLTAGINPLAASFAGLASFSPLAAYYAQSGLGHSAGSDPRIGNDYTDPYVSTRIAQTFPFVHWGYSPFAWPSG